MKETEIDEVSSIIKSILHHLSLWGVMPQDGWGRREIPLYFAGVRRAYMATALLARTNYGTFEHIRSMDSTLNRADGSFFDASS